MAPVVIWILVALAAAAVVLVVASATGDRSGGLGQFLTDLRGGLGRDPSGERPGPLRGFRRDLTEVAEVEASSVDEIFGLGTSPGSAYLGTVELSETLVRARQRAVRGATSMTRR